MPSAARPAAAHGGRTKSVFPQIAAQLVETACEPNKCVARNGVGALRQAWGSVQAHARRACRPPAPLFAAAGSSQALGPFPPLLPRCPPTSVLPAARGDARPPPALATECKPPNKPRVSALRGCRTSAPEAAAAARAAAAASAVVAHVNQRVWQRFPAEPCCLGCYQLPSAPSRLFWRPQPVLGRRAPERLLARWPP